MRKIGVIVGREWSWPPAFIEEVNRRNAGVTAEYVKLGGTQMAAECDYDVIIDRISHEIPYYRTFLKNAVLAGTTVINNPFWWSADDKFFGASLATRLGVAHPKTVALPSHSYVEGVVEESLRNLVYPLPWEQHINYLGGFPVILKPAWGGGFKQVYKLDSYADLWRTYNETGTECMMLQEYIAWDKYVRCIVIGREHVMTIKFDANAPWPNRYFRDDTYLTSEEGLLVLEGALKLNQALGYDMNTVEFAIKDGVPYAIDFTNPAPDFDVNSLTPHYFDWVVKTMADFTIRLALDNYRQSDDFMWARLLNHPNTSATILEHKVEEALDEIIGTDEPPTTTTDEAPPVPTTGTVNLNTATLADLICLPGIGPTLAKRILAYRAANGSFASVQALEAVQGITTKSITQFAHLLTVE